MTEDKYYIIYCRRLYLSNKFLLLDPVLLQNTLCGKSCKIWLYKSKMYMEVCNKANDIKKKPNVLSEKRK